MAAFAEGQFSLGLNGDGWTSSYGVPFRGYEVFSPMTLSFKLGPDVSLYGQTEYASGSYTDSLNGTETLVLSNISDTVTGGVFRFKLFSLSSLLNVAVNIPTGDTSWETRQIPASIPTEFIDSRYRGRGFGVSSLLGLSLPETSGEYGVAAGYLYSQAFNPSYGLNLNTSSSLKIGDAVFVALNHVQPDGTDRREVARVSAYYSLPTAVNGQNIFQMGTNFNASYAWEDPKAFSLELGAQAYLSSNRLLATGNFGIEDHNSFAPRCYATASYVLGDFALSARAKYILPNDYTTLDLYYDGGGFLAGIEPSYRVHFDDDTSFRISVSFDDVYAINEGIDSLGNRADVDYEMWSLGTTYELKL